MYTYIERDSKLYFIEHFILKKILTYSTKIKLHDKMRFDMYKNETEHKQKNMY